MCAKWDFVQAAGKGSREVLTNLRIITLWKYQCYSAPAFKKNPSIFIEKLK